MHLILDTNQQIVNLYWRAVHKVLELIQQTAVHNWRHIYKSWRYFYKLYYLLEAHLQMVKKS